MLSPAGIRRVGSCCRVAAHIFPACSLQYNVQTVTSRALLEYNLAGFNHLEGHYLCEYSAHFLLEVTKVRVPFHHVHNHDDIAV